MCGVGYIIAFHGQATVSNEDTLSEFRISNQLIQIQKSISEMSYHLTVAANKRMAVSALPLPCIRRIAVYRCDGKEASLHNWPVSEPYVNTSAEFLHVMYSRL